MKLVTECTMKIVSYAIFFWPTALVCLIASSGQANIKKAFCTSSNITVNPDYKCSAKAYSRTNQALNIYASLRKPLYEINVALDISYKTTSISYRSIIKCSYDACGFLNGTSINPAAKWVTDLAEKTLPPDYIHPCPYSVSVLLLYTCLEMIIYLLLTVKGENRF